MKKHIGYIPAVLFTALYLFIAFSGTSFAMSTVLIWIACFWISGILIHKGAFWGGLPGLIPAIHMITMGTRFSGQVMDIEIPLGIALIIFYTICGILLWKKRKDEEYSKGNNEALQIALKLIVTVGTVIVSLYAGIILAMIFFSEGINNIIAFVGIFLLPTLIIPLVWLRKKKLFLIIWSGVAVIFSVALLVNIGINKYNDSITINTSPNININEYLPFTEETKIVKKDSEAFKLSGNLPRIDGAAALFPVYSAFVNAVYPNTTKLHDGVFEYNNTPEGYRRLAEKKTDIFIGVYPSEEQRAYAKECNTTFKYTPIGTEAFVFFVHKDNPIDSLTSAQIRDIYQGKITNWKDVGGRDEEIVAFQRNEGSGSQSMLKRFMGDVPIMEAPKERVNDLMSGIIERVSDYKSKSNSIGFSFRFYVEGIIKNPDIKMICVDGVVPSAENVKNGTYPIVTPIYAVTYEENTNENTQKLLDWILSREGQDIIEETGYVGIG